MNTYKTYKKIISRTDVILSDDHRKDLLDFIAIHEEKIKELEKIFPKGCPIEVHYGWEGQFNTAIVDHVEIDDIGNNRIHYIYDHDEDKKVISHWWSETGIGITGPWIEKSGRTEFSSSSAMR